MRAYVDTCERVRYFHDVTTFSPIIPWVKEKVTSYDLKILRQEI